MDTTDGSPPASLCMIRAAELFPKPQMEKEDTQLTVPFQELAGESVKYLGHTDDGVLALSNYRIFLQKNSTNFETSIPLGLIESLQARDLFHLIVYCKDASTVKCSFETAEQCTEWQRRLQVSIGVPETLESIFAFPFCSWTCDTLNNGTTQNGSYMVTSGGGAADFAPFFMYPAGGDYAERLQRAPSRYEDDFMHEVERLGFDLNGPWRISQANEDFKLCPSYPTKVLVPCCISDDTLNNVANFRGSRRLPAVVWRHRKSGAVIARCSQPEVGWLGWRNTKDEQLLKALADACAFDRGEQMRALGQIQNNTNINTTTTFMTTATSATTTNTSPLTITPAAVTSGDSSPASADGSHEDLPLDEVRKILIVDARSYTSAVTNRARGGGCECIEYYPCAEIEFMNLGNIHVIRKSFHALRQLCASPPDVPNWLGLLEKTMWLQHLSGLLAASMTVCHAIEKKGRPVLVHCSDGWDRTPQIVATAQLCLDPYYRTVDGFRILVEREWLSYGHKFADRCGHGPGSDELNERCPVFLQWLDLVHQIHKQFPCSFEFSMGFLIKLAQHSHSGLFGTFLCNTLKERIENSVFERTFSVWPFLSGPMYRNPLYISNKEKVLWPVYNVRDLSLWTEVYLGSLGGIQNSIDYPTYINDSVPDAINSMSKTRSYGDLITASIIQNGISRRSSDPNMAVDPNLTIGSNSENNSIADLQLDEREESPDILANLIHDTTLQLENLTIELNNHDDDDFGIQLCSNVTTTRKALDDDAPNTLNEHIIHALTNEISETTNDCDLLNLNHLTSTALNETNDRISQQQPNDLCKVEIDANQDNLAPHSSIPINMNLEKSFNLSLDLKQSANVADTMGKPLTSSCNGCLKDDSKNMWHGSVNTSTDTLVPITDVKGQTNIERLVEIDMHPKENEQIITDGCVTSHIMGNTQLDKDKEICNNLNTNNVNNSTNINTSSNILPKVHSSSVIRPQRLSTSSTAIDTVNTVKTITDSSSCSLTKISASTSSAVIANNFNNNSHSQRRQQQQQPNEDNKIATITKTINADDDNDDNDYDHNNGDDVPASIMEESIFILPEHEKLEISFSGKCEAIANTHASTNPFITQHNNISNNTPTTAAAITTTPLSSSINLYNMPYGSFFASNAIHTHHATAATASFNTTTQTRRRRTSSSNSRRDGLISKNLNGSYLSRFSLPGGGGGGGGGGVRSLPMTPPGVMERQSIAISCPDGLAHALSEENIRLQQIVHEHKLREDVLLREIHDMRMALLKKICPNCNNASATNNTNDDQCSALDNIENASICSWEAVEDRSVSGPSSCNTSSSMQPNPSSVLWVPDHAVSRCTSCQTEFWLGRRKHHCRSCGQIFCADCSEFWAALPDAKLFSPVRLCGPCYHSVTTRVQQQQTQQQQTRCSITASNGITAGSISQQQQSRSILTSTGRSSLAMGTHQQQNQCATASMKVNNSTTNAATAAATTTATN